MHRVNIHEAKTHSSRLLEEVANGGEVVIAKAGYSVARLVPWRDSRTERRFGWDAGLFEVPEDFERPLPDEIMASL